MEKKERKKKEKKKKNKNKKTKRNRGKLQIAIPILNPLGYDASNYSWKNLRVLFSQNV